MTASTGHVVVGIDNGGTKNNATILDEAGRFLVDRMHEVPSRVMEGPEAAIEAMVESMEVVLDAAGVALGRVAAVGLDTPGPASADGVISSLGATNFAQPAWRGFDVRGALEARIGLPVVYNNDGNAAALYAHHVHFGDRSAAASSVSAIVGTGLGGGVIESGHVIRGASGQAGEFGHIRIPLDGILMPDQPMPTCNCGLAGDVESVASLTGILRNLLPYWLTKHPEHPLAALPLADAAKAVRSYGEAATSWRARCSSSRRRRWGGSSPWRPTSPILRATSWVAAWWRRPPRSATGSWTGCAPTPRCARSRPRWPSSPWSPIATWPAPGAPPSRRWSC